MTAASASVGTTPPAAPPGGGNAFSWRFTTPLFMGSALNPVNSSLIATALVPIAATARPTTADLTTARPTTADLTTARPTTADLTTARPTTEENL